MADPREPVETPAEPPVEPAPAPTQPAPAEAPVEDGDGEDNTAA